MYFKTIILDETQVLSHITKENKEFVQAGMDSLAGPQFYGGPDMQRAGCPPKSCPLQIRPSIKIEGLTRRLGGGDNPLSLGKKGAISLSNPFFFNFERQYPVTRLPQYCTRTLPGAMFGLFYRTMLCVAPNNYELPARTMTIC